jgi:hypothetical protein
VVKDEIKTSTPPSQFAIHQTDGKTVLIEAIVPTDKPASFEDVFDVYSKKETVDSDWIKVCKNNCILIKEVNQTKFLYISRLEHLTEII